MSKTKGTFVMPATYLKHLDPAWARYYYASKLGPRLDDLDLSLDEFVDKINADLVGKVVNLASRTAKFVQQTGLSKTYPDDGGLFAQGAAAGAEIAAAYENCDYSRAMRLIMELADRAHPYIDAKKPGGLAKQPGNEAELQNVCTVGLNLFRQIVIYLAPVLPKLAEQAGALLNDPITTWQQSQQPLIGTPVAPFSHMMKRGERKELEAMIEESNPQETGNSGQEPGAGGQQTAGDSDAALQAEPLVA